MYSNQLTVADFSERYVMSQSRLLVLGIGQRKYITTYARIDRQISDHHVFIGKESAAKF
jgi:hypothetical protein